MALIYHASGILIKAGYTAADVAELETWLSEARAQLRKGHHRVTEWQHADTKSVRVLETFTTMQAIEEISYALMILKPELYGSSQSAYQAGARFI